MIYRHLLAVSCFVALAVWLLSRGWRRLPWFGAYLAAQLPLLVGYRPEQNAWLQTWWVWLTPAVVVLRIAATWEAFRVHSDADATAKQYRRRMGLSLLALSVGLMALVWTFVPGSPLQNIVQARRLIQIGLAAFLGLYVTLMWSAERLGAGWRLRHVLGLLAMLLILAGISVASMSVRPWSRETWHLVDDAANVAMAAVLLTWAALVPPAARRDAPAPGDPAPTPADRPAAWQSPDPHRPIDP